MSICFTQTDYVTFYTSTATFHSYNILISYKIHSLYLIKVELVINKEKFIFVENFMSHYLEYELLSF